MAVRVADSLKQQNDLDTFPVAYGEDIWLDKNKGSGTENYSSLQEMFDNNELGGNSTQVTTMPTASETYLDTVLLYIGETGTYKYGTYYKCVSDGETPPTYSWVDAGIGGGTKIFYGTMDEWDALSADEKKQYDYMADNNAGGSYIDSYSTTEVKTNKVWIDGKPVYRKVFNMGSVADTTEKRISISALNVELAIKIDFIAVAPNKYQWNRPVLTQTLVVGANMYIDYRTGELVYISNTALAEYTQSYAILEYTKTTD